VPKESGSLVDKVNQPFQRSLRFRFGDRVGLIPRLLFCSLLAILSTTAHVQVMTLRSVRENGLRQAEESLGISMSVLRHELAMLGTSWSTTAASELLLGGTKLNDRNDIVDTVGSLTGAPQCFCGIRA
jgi:hypothetical protein